MRKKFTLLIALIFVCSLVFILTGCGEKLIYTARTSTEIGEDGWVYNFVYCNPREKYKEIFEEDEIAKTYFFGINLRHRDSNRKMMVFGETPDSEHDGAIVSQIMDYDNHGASEETLRKTDYDTLDFDYLDNGMFKKIVIGALDSEERKEGKYINVPEWGLFNENNFTDDFEFQIGLINNVGNIDVICIEAVDREGKSVSLTDRQKEIIKDIEKGIVDNNNLIFGKEKYSTVIDGMDFGRLYTMLENLEQ